MERPGISSGDVIELDICGERTSASRGVLTQVLNLVCSVSCQSKAFYKAVACCFLKSMNPKGMEQKGVADLLSACCCANC